MVVRVLEHGLHSLVLVEAFSHMQLAVRQAEMREPAGARLLFLVFFRVHEEHEPGPRRHRPQRIAPAELLRPEAAVAHLSHQKGTNTKQRRSEARTLNTQARAVLTTD